MKSHNCKKVVVIIGAVAFVLMATAIISAFYFKQNGKVAIFGFGDKDKRVDLTQVKNTYLSSTKTIVNNYLSKDMEIKDDNYTDKAENAKKAIDELMKLTLTKEEKEIHLNLVLALSDAERGWQLTEQGMKEEGQKLVAGAKKKLDEIIKENEWLK